MARIGLVLSGGMAKGIYQIGVLKAIEKYIDQRNITCISAASIGALNAYAYATGKLDFAEKIWKEAACEGNRYIATLINSGFLKQSINTLAESRAIAVPKFYTPIYNLSLNRLFYIDIQKKVQELHKDYLRAAVAMPVFNEPVVIEGNHYYDGAIIDNIPIRPLYEEPLDYIICVYFDNCNYIFEDKYLDQRVIKIVIYNEQRIKSSLRLDKERMDLMIREGYDKTSCLLDFLFMEGQDDLEKIYKKKKEIEKSFLLSQTRITGDVVVNNFNRIAKKIVKNNCNLIK